MRRLALAMLLAALVLTACGDVQAGGMVVGTSPPTLRPVQKVFGSGDSGNPTWRLVALGDSISYGKDCPGCTTFVDLFAGGVARRAGVTVVRTNWSIPGLGSGRLLDIVDHDAELRADLARADVVTITIGVNDLPWTPGPDECGATLREGQVDWTKITPACLRQTAARYATELDHILGEIERLRAGTPTLLRVTGIYDDWIGRPGVPADDRAIVARGVRLFDRAQQRAAAAHGGASIDLLHAFNGPGGHGDAGAYLEPSHGVHPDQQGHTLIARLLLALGVSPLRS